MIVIEDLRKTFYERSRGEVHAVDGVGFRVSAGEVYGLLGPNGAGKTTTLRIIATLTGADGGRILIDGIDRFAHPLQTRQRMAYVAAEAGLPDRLSAREVVRLFAGV